MNPAVQRILEMQWTQLQWTTNKLLGGSCCPLCNVEHLVCRFEGGTLFCVMDKYTGFPCTNPHHRRNS